MKTFWTVRNVIFLISILIICLGSKKVDDIPEVIQSPSCAGEVTFEHKFHFEGLEIGCADCHHETNATELKMPHESYFKDFWIDCKICHKENSGTIMEAQDCSSCHHKSPTNIADETLSAKVVIHKNCWQCHEIGTGQTASENCVLCHSGNKTDCD